MSLRRHPFTSQRERNAHIREQAQRIARTVTVPDGLAPIPVAVVPANTRETEALPERTRRIFLDRLESILGRVFATVPTDGATPTAEATAALADACPDPNASTAATDLDAILGRSCATCRGECCTAGGDHTFLREDSLLRVRGQDDSLDQSALLASYASYLPTRHYRGSCVYHTTEGCALPRAMRSNLCNRYICGGLTQLKSALQESGSTMAFVGAADSVHLRRLSLIDAHDATPIALG